VARSRSGLFLLMGRVGPVNKPRFSSFRFSSIQKLNSLNCPSLSKWRFVRKIANDVVKWGRSKCKMATMICYNHIMYIICSLQNKTYINVFLTKTNAHINMFLTKKSVHECVVWVHSLSNIKD
jgi:hypothetical protein